MLNPDCNDMLSAFFDAGVEYLIAGAYALAAHGLPRAPGDLNLSVLYPGQCSTGLSKP